MTSIQDISVIVCAYNHEKWISRCIRSLSNQEGLTEDNYEIIFVDDASKDNTLDIIESFRFIPNLKIIKNKKNIGLSKSLNLAIKSSVGRYIVRVDSDDYVAKYFLFMQKLFLDYNRNYHAVAVDYKKVDSNEQEIGRHNCKEDFIACGVMFRKEILVQLGMYNPKFGMREGHELINRFLQNGYQLGRLEFPVYKYRIHDTNRTKNKNKLKIYEKKIGKL